MKIQFTLFVTLLLVTLTEDNTFAQMTISPKEPDAKDKCPVCGMFVIEYPWWWSEIIFEDTSVRFFDGAKDMFKYYQRTGLYEKPEKKQIAFMYVRDYYTLHWIDARKAYYVADSDVLGPMGYELIPLKTKEDALEFMQDHQGRNIFRFEDITWELLHRLSEGMEM